MNADSKKLNDSPIMIVTNAYLEGNKIIFEKKIVVIF